MGLYDKAWDFIDAVKSTKEYIELLEAKNDIENNEALKKEIYKFYSMLNEIDGMYEDVDTPNNSLNELDINFSALSKIPKIDRFLNASKEYENNIGKVYKCINESLQISFKINKLN
jgi:cell fate (sporulation/competence/biofilm development) regulator YlbF (YheA/YmcA/DUF963 family)